MPPVDTPSLAYQMSYALSGLESQEARAVEQRHTEARSCTDTRETGQYGRGKLLELAAVRGEDPTHILFRRHVEVGSLCIDLEAYYLERDAIALKKMVESEDQDLEEHHGRFMARLRRFYQFGCLFSKVMEFEKPSGVFLETSLWFARTKWGEENNTHLRANDDDWASLYKTEKLDQWLVFLLHHPLSRRLMRALKLVSKEGDIAITYLPGTYAKFALVGLFNCFVCIFVSAPVAILTLNPMTPAGTIATYLGFVLVAGFLIQWLIKGFTRQLLVYLAYASVMAAVMRLKE